ncbi:hypothetical protein BCO26_0200 [Heyndrickxia coagulans 2-6]|nr:hypothetical protein BCO26_0200 [Heyndrickxia coagulans 2-6]
MRKANRFRTIIKMIRNTMLQHPDSRIGFFLSFPILAGRLQEITHCRKPVKPAKGRLSYSLL